MVVLFLFVKGCVETSAHTLLTELYSKLNCKSVLGKLEAFAAASVSIKSVQK